MGGRRCIIISSAAQIPTTVPEGQARRTGLEKKLRLHLQNSAVAGELDEEPTYSIVKTILDKPGSLGQTDLQTLLDIIHSVPPTE
jgi:hypothetical protein